MPTRVLPDWAQGSKYPLVSIGFAIPHINEGKEKQYFPDFIARVQTPRGWIVNLIVEITSMNRDKATKKQYVEDRWLRAANRIAGPAVREHYGYDEWYFIEIANDIRFVKNQLAEKIGAMEPTEPSNAEVLAFFRYE